MNSPARTRPQYHYFYGSTNDTIPMPEMSPGHESEALIGESLVPTDTEEETPNNSEQDLQHLLVTNVRNGMLPPMVGKTVTGDPYLFETDHHVQRRPKSLFSSLCNAILHGSEGHPFGQATRIFLVTLLALSLCTLAMLVSPYDFGGAMGGTAAGSENGATRSFQYIPFRIVDRMNYNDPATSVVDLDLFDPALLYHGTKDKTRRPTGDAIDPVLKVPFPTGAFWTNLILKPTADQGFSYPVVVYPYAYKWSDTILQASYPALHRRQDKISIRDTFIPDISLATEESIVKRFVTDYDPLSVTTRFYTDSGGYWESYLVQGSPYITVKYDSATPIIHALSIFRNFVCPVDSDGKYNGDTSFDTMDDDSDGRRLAWGVCTSSSSSPLVDTSSGNNGISLHGVQFLLQTNEGLMWMLFSSEPIALTFDTLSKTTVTAGEKFTGVLRLALIPPSSEGNKQIMASDGSLPLSTSTGLRRLIYHSRVYPIGGSVSWEFRSGSPQSSVSQVVKKAVSDVTFNFGKAPSNKIGTVHYTFNTKLMTENSNSRPNSVHDDLLMLSLPHHAKLLPRATVLSPKKFDLTFRCVKGKMTPILGDSWSYDENLTSVGFDDLDVDSYTRGLDQRARSVILENIPSDLERVLPTLDENVYGFGKQVARLAQLAHIENMMELAAPDTAATNQTTKTSSSQQTFAAEAMQKLQWFLQEFFKNDVADRLLFDAKFGGVVTRDGLLDTEADFGNGRYNDHHFHYGYILYACAIMGRLNATFVSEYGSFVDTLLFDVAHSSNGSPEKVDGIFFPLARHMSWYDGHSFASGLFPFGNGKSQESSSEAVNSYYGAYLWSLVRENEGDTGSELSDFARLLLAMEIRGAKTYWHMRPPAPSNTTSSSPTLVYNPSFAENYMVGNLGMLDAVCSTWFGTASLYVHMINFLPVTGITAELFDKAYVKEEFENVIGPLHPGTEMAWRGYVISDHAIIDPSKAWVEAQEIVSYELDAAISKSQVLYWITTRPGFAITPDNSKEPASTDIPKEDGSATGSGQSASCERNPGCADAGLQGLCCPTTDGTFLQCCKS